jgi:hypothetical protein
MAQAGREHGSRVGRYRAGVRRLMPLSLTMMLSLLVLPLVACASTRDRAHDDFVDQFVDEGGLSRTLAECIVDGFFEDRSTEELKEFFDREGLTDAEEQEFTRLGEACQKAP